MSGWVAEVDTGVSFSVLFCAVFGFLCWRGWLTFFDMMMMMMMMMAWWSEMILPTYVKLEI